MYFQPYSHAIGLRIITTVLSTILFISHLQSATTEIHVSAKSDDAITVSAALQKARELKKNKPNETIEIVIDAGYYELAEPLRLTPMDSGLTIRAAEGTTPVLSGGRRINGWKRDPATPGVWTVTLDEVRNGSWYFQQLFINNKRAQRARTPNTGYYHAVGSLNSEPITMKYNPDEFKPQWAKHPDAQLIMLLKWTDLHLPILTVDASQQIIKLAKAKFPSWRGTPNSRYWIENIPEALDQPGEWYLDRKTGRLSYLAPDGVDPNQMEIIAPRLTEIVTIVGNNNRPVQSVRLQGLTFAHTDYVMPKEGLMLAQGASLLPGAFLLNHAIDCAIEDCTFENMGGYAIELGQGAQRCHIVGNNIANMGAGGIRIGERSNRTPTKTDACHTHTITDNSITQLGRVFASGCGIIVFQSGSNRIAHNHINDLYYTGISVGWTWGYRNSPCHDNIIEYNLIENCGQKRLSDMGGIYTLGPQFGTVIQYNLIRDIQSYNYGGWGLYTDEGSSGIVMENNVAYRCSDAGFHQHYGEENIIRNNLFAWNERHSVMRTKVEDHLSFQFIGNVVIADSGTLLGSNWNGTTQQVYSDYNLWYDTRYGTNVDKYEFAGSSWAKWQARGHAVHSIIADPLLIDPKKPELGLKPSSPAFKLGYRQIDLNTVGPRSKSKRSR